MNIIYPPLVEQAYRWAIEQGFSVSKDEVYRMQVEQGMITETGEPTKEAISQGLVSEYHTHHETLWDFKKEFSIFKEYPAKEFTQQEGIWYVSLEILEEFTERIESKRYGHDEELQMKAYISVRNYGDPQTISEFKGVYHPWYTKYDDLQFQELPTGGIGIPQGVIEDMIVRAEQGELDMEADKLRELIRQMEQQ